MCSFKSVASMPEAILGTYRACASAIGWVWKANKNGSEHRRGRAMQPKEEGRVVHVSRVTQQYQYFDFPFWCYSLLEMHFRHFYIVKIGNLLCRWYLSQLGLFVYPLAPDPTRKLLVFPFRLRNDVNEGFSCKVKHANLHHFARYLRRDLFLLEGFSSHSHSPEERFGFCPPTVPLVYSYRTIDKRDLSLLGGFREIHISK
jgi:hypothetical protein